MTTRIVYFGTPEISVPALSHLHAAGVDIAAVVTQPDRTRGRNRKQLLPPPVKVEAMRLGLPVMQPESCKQDEVLAQLAELNADAFCVFAFGQILPQALLDIPRFGCFNAHASLLPHLRGAAPINWGIVRGDAEGGMTIQRMVFKLDAGPICWQKAVPIAARETASSLGQKLIPLAGEGLAAVLEMAASGTLDPKEQDHASATYAPLMKKDDGTIDWRKSAVEIDRMVRGFNPWPAATTACEAEQIKIYDSLPLGMDAPADAQPGKVLDVTKNEIRVACGQGVLAIKELQRQGKKRMDVCAYLCGCPVYAGMVFESLDAS